MAPRERSMSLGSYQQGFWRRFGSTSGGGSIQLGNAFVSDHTGPGDCDPFHTERYFLDGGIIDQAYDPGWWGAYFEGYMADGVSPANFPHLGMTVPVPSTEEAALSAAMRTSPSAPYVDVITNVLQLGELTTLIRNKGYELLRQRNSAVNRNIANNYIKYQFGIAPLVGDIVKLSRFQDQVARRVQQIEKLKSKGGLRKTVDIGIYDRSATYGLTLQSQGTFVGTTVSAHTKMVMSAHCRWIPTDIPAISTPKLMRNLAMKAVLGATIDYGTLWEILPWSWLIDWGFNVSGYLRANRNIVPASLTDVVVMTHTMTNSSTPALGPFQNDYGRTFSAVNMGRDTKRRVRSYVSPAAHFPFLSGSQMGILASLAVTRM